MQCTGFYIIRISVWCTQTKRNQVKRLLLGINIRTNIVVFICNWKYRNQNTGKPLIFDGTTPDLPIMHRAYDALIVSPVLSMAWYKIVFQWNIPLVICILVPGGHKKNTPEGSCVKLSCAYRGNTMYSCDILCYFFLKHLSGPES